MQLSAGTKDKNTAEYTSVHHLLSVVSDVIQEHKFVNQGPKHLHMIDLNMGDGTFADGFIDAYYARAKGSPCSIMVSGTSTNDDLLEIARQKLRSKGALGAVHDLDASTTVGQSLRNKLKGGADMVAFIHAAYPDMLPGFKLSRMVDRLSDVVTPNGGIVTLHDSGKTDADHLRSHVLKQGCFAAQERNCDTQSKLENAFAGKKHVYSFCVSMPSHAQIPANLKAIDALFHQREESLEGADAEDAAVIRSVLEEIAGGKEALDDAIGALDKVGKAAATQFFESRQQEARGGTVSLTTGSSQMVLAFHNLEVAQAAFAAMQQETCLMHPPALVLPNSPGIARNMDKQAAYDEWADRLKEEYGITRPPEVAQLCTRQMRR